MKKLRSAADLEERVLELGFLPFFRNSIKGFSVEEMTDPNLWFSKDVEGPWEWKGPVARRHHVAYGKLMGGKAMYVSREWYADFVLWRRAVRTISYPAPGTFEASDVLHAIEEYCPIVSKDLKKIFEAVPRRRTAADLVDLTGLDKIEYKVNSNALEHALTALQMGGRVLIEDFEYSVDRNGKKYGWGLARYSTPEAMFGSDFLAEAKATNPVEAMHLMYEHLHHLLPAASDRQINSILK